ncbi:hypothetical protein MEQU1_000570 [Malassezia equina]|uniref:Uncharacterized protein n=1 Tax=Malassezia equina TaxID=1381935 RepID=A0AAF0EC37_9BASI|nr:hypothetical protein MEQU1_000570 [Malassezia equina]
MSRSSVRSSGAGPSIPTPPVPIRAQATSPDPLQEPVPVPSLGLHRATSSGNVALVLYALENGQSPNAAIHGITPLHVAACIGHVTTAKLLMSFGADVNQPKGRSKVAGPGVEGSTPLHFAAANGHVDLVRTLLLHGARPQSLDRNGNTPELLASVSSSAPCVALLRQWIDMYGPEGHSDPAALQDTYAWGDRVILAPSREGTPVTGALSPILSPQALRDTTPPHSPTVPDMRPRSSLPSLFEKASHPASSLRAALFSSSATSRTDDVSVRSSRLPTRASLTGLFRRGGPTADEELDARLGRTTRARAHSEAAKLPSLDTMVSPAWSIPLTPTSFGPPPSSSSLELPAGEPAQAWSQGSTASSSSQSLLQTLRPVAQLDSEPTETELQRAAAAPPLTLASGPLPALSWQASPESDNESHSKLALYLAHVGSSMHSETP